MSIMFITGVPRSGKTYRSVYKIWKMYRNDLKPLGWFMSWFRYFFPLEPKQVYKYTYTNINQFNFDYSPQIKKLIYSDLYSKLTILYGLYRADSNDDVLKSKAKELHIYDSLFVIDESHNFFDKSEDKVITWWLTYHGHLHQEIHLITQQIKLIAPKYKEIAEFFFKAYASSNQVSTKNFRYSQHKCSGYYKQESNPNIFTPVNQDVFNLYVSGKSQKRVNKMKKYLYIFPPLFILIYFLFSFFVDLFSSPVVDSVDSNVTVQSLVTDPLDSNQTIDEVEKVPLDFEKEILAVFTCINTSCYYKNNYVPISFLKYAIEAYPPKYYDIQSHQNNFVQYTLTMNKKLTSMLLPDKKSKKGSKDEKSVNPISSIF